MMTEIAALVNGSLKRLWSLAQYIKKSFAKAIGLIKVCL